MAQLLKAHGVAVYRGTGQFESRRCVAVADGGREPVRLEAENIIIATGVVPLGPWPFCLSRPCLTAGHSWI